MTQTRWITLILAVAALLRSLYLGKDGFWLDEFVTWQCTRDFGKVLTAEPSNPPFYYMLVFPWVELFGRSEIAFRSLSILPSLGSVFLAYWIGRRVISTPAGLCAAAYQAISSFHIFYAQEARAHAWLVFFLLSGSWLLLVALDRKGFSQMRLLALYTIVMTIALYTHFIGIFFLAGHGVYVIALWLKSRDRESWRQLWQYSISLVLVLLFFSPWLIQMLKTAAAGGQVRRFLFLKPFQAYFSFLFGDSLVPFNESAVRNVVGTLKQYAPQLAAAVLAAVLILPFVWRAIQRSKDKALFPLVMAIAPVLLCLLVSLKVMVFDERYMQTASPFLYMLLAAGMVEAWATRGPGRYAGLLSIALFVILSALSLRNYYFDPQFGKEQWREVVAYVESGGTPQTDLILYEPEYLFACFDYYKKGDISGWRIFDPIAQEIVENRPEAWNKILGYKRVWLIRSHHRNDVLLDALSKRMPVVNERNFDRGKGIDIHVFQPGP